MKLFSHGRFYFLKQGKIDFFSQPEVALFCLNMASNIGDGDGEMEQTGLSCFCDYFLYV